MQGTSCSSGVGADSWFYRTELLRTLHTIAGKLPAGSACASAKTVQEACPSPVAVEEAVVSAVAGVKPCSHAGQGDRGWWLGWRVEWGEGVSEGGGCRMGGVWEWRGG